MTSINKITTVNKTKMNENKMPVINKKDLSVMNDHVTNILVTISENPVTNVVSLTGTGKTTKLPMEIAKAGNKIMVVVKDRHVAQSLSKYVSSTVSEETSDIMSYTGQSDLKEFLYKHLNKGKCLDLDFADILMIDEADLQTVDQYIIMSIWKHCAERKGKIPRLLLVSNIEVRTNLFDSALYEVSSYRYPIVTRYLGNDLYNRVRNNIADYCLELVDDIYDSDNSNNNSNYLIFATDPDEVDYIVSGLQHLLDEVNIIGVTGNPSQETLDRIYSNNSNSNNSNNSNSNNGNNSKIIVTDRFGETSFSVQNLSVIVDLMFDVQAEQSLTGGTRIKRQHISKDKTQTRSRRGGKDRSTLNYRLISKSMYDKLKPNTVPEICRTPIHQVILDLVINGLDYRDILMGLDQQVLNRMYDLLFRLGAINVNNQITKLGKFINHSPYGVRQSAILFKWLQQNPGNYEIIPILSMIDAFSEPFWVRPMISPNMPQIEYKLLLLNHDKKYFEPFEAESDVHTFAKLWRIMQDETGSVNPSLDQIVAWSTDNSINVDVMEIVKGLNDYFLVHNSNNNSDGNNSELNLNIVDLVGPIIKEVYSDKKLVNDSSRDKIVYLDGDKNRNRYIIDSRFALNTIENKVPKSIYGLITSEVSSLYSDNFNTVAVSLV